MTDRTLSRIAIGLSVASLGYAAWVHYEGSEVLATRALQRREAELVRELGPRMLAIYRDMVPNSTHVLKTATTLPELLDPLIALMEAVGDTSNPTNQVINK